MLILNEIILISCEFKLISSKTVSKVWISIAIMLIVSEIMLISCEIMWILSETFNRLKDGLEIFSID